MKRNYAATRNLLLALPVLGLIGSGLLTTGCRTTGPTVHSKIVSHYDAAKAFYRDRAFESAAAAFQEFLADNPNNALVESATYYLASSLKEAGDLEQAARIYDDLLHRYSDGIWVDLARNDLQQIGKILSGR